MSDLNFGASPQHGDITAILRRWTAGDATATSDLAPLVYEHLRKVALSYLRKERADHTLQATGLVNELFVRLLRLTRVEVHDRTHFYAFAARAMRGILVDHARARAAAKRAGVQIPLAPDLAWIDADGPAMLDLGAALDELEALDQTKARIVELRVFLGCTAAEAAEMTGVSKATADRGYKFALGWLADRLGGTP